MQLKRIVKGHYNELMNINEEIANKRMEICKRCPLFTTDPTWGPLCNPQLYLNTTTMEVKDNPAEGFKKGCGCRLKAKTRDLESHCPTNQW
jgi:hypothetical protein